MRHQVQQEDQPLLEFPRYYLVSHTSVAQRPFCHFLLSSFVRKLPAASFRLRNWHVAIADSCSWAILATLLRMWFNVVLWWVAIPNSSHSFSIIRNLGFLKRHYTYSLNDFARLGTEPMACFAASTRPVVTPRH